MQIDIFFVFYVPVMFGNIKFMNKIRLKIFTINKRVSGRLRNLFSEENILCAKKRITM